MARIATIILGNPTYHDDMKVSSTLAVTFYDKVESENIYLSVVDEQTKTRFRIPAVNKDASDTFQENQQGDSTQTHLHFQLDNLTCNNNYSYKVKAKNKEKIVIDAIADTKPKRHSRIPFTAAPLPGQKKLVHIIASADQEVIDVAHWTKADEVLSAHLGLQLNQKSQTTTVYDEIGRRKPDVFLHLSDLFHGENYVPMKTVRKLEEFRHAIDEDFHQTVRANLAGAYSFRILDDHDFGQNDASPEMYKKDPRPYDNAVNAFNEFWPVPTILEDGHRGLFYFAQYGDCGFWCLNDRLFQTESGGLIGEQQYHWLEQSIRQSNLKAKFILSPLPFVMGKNPKDDYRSHDVVWDKILNLAAEVRITALLCADSHNYSRTDIKVIKGDYEVTIPHLLIGILGGKPQEITKEERKALPTPLIPPTMKDKYADSKVQTYYTAIPKPGGKGFKDAGITFIPGKKEYRAYKDGEWVGQSVAKSAYGFADLSVDFENKKMMTHLFLLRQQKDGGKPVLEDHAEYPLKAKRTKRV